MSAKQPWENEAAPEAAEATAVDEAIAAGDTDLDPSKASPTSTITGTKDNPIKAAKGRQASVAACSMLSAGISMKEIKKRLGDKMYAD